MTAPRRISTWAIMSASRIHAYARQQSYHGRIYEQIIQRERRGDYLGKTVQVIPHVTNEIKAAIKRISADVDVVICEIGGTVGDIESLPFLEAIRQVRHEVGPRELHLSCM